MPIRQLPPLLVNQIAAGEVIERPASVVKELVENSLDAGATRVEVTIADGGRELIRIADDGGGIPPAELPLAIAPHATSKLQSAEQLAAIHTLGFRGEALASIASVSRLSLSSRLKEARGNDASGHVIEVTGDQVSPVRPFAMAPGTVIEVRDLFFNTPARRKFMRAAPTEFGHIADVIDRIALVHPAVGFTLRHNDRLVRDVPPVTDRRLRCLDILGRELDEAMLEAINEPPPQVDGEVYKVWALAGLPAAARATAKFQYVYVNRRPVRDRNLSHAIKEAYRGLMMPDLQPVAVVFIDMPFEAVDVNVHPTKSEVRFRDPSRLHGLVLTTLRQRLLGADLTPKVQTPGFGMGAWKTIDGEAGGLSPVEMPQANPGAPSTDAFVDYFKRMAPQQKGFAFEEVKRALIEENPTLLAGDAAEGMAASMPPALRPQHILQVHESYVVTQDDQGLVIIDQHALHERVMFEELSRRILGPETTGKLESQRLLMPAVLTASPKRAALAEVLGPLLERIGVEMQPLGPGSLAIQAFPTFLFDRGVEPVEFMSELLDRAEEGEFDAALVGDKTPRSDQGLVTEAVLHKVIDMMSCKAAVKAGDKLSSEELSALLAKRDQIERAGSCPHGRPTTIRLTLRDLEKQFKRVL